MLDSNDDWDIHAPYRPMAKKLFAEVTGKNNLTSISDFADFLEKMDDSEDTLLGFDMRVSTPADSNQTDHPCGTACCIGGWVRLLTGSRKPINFAMMNTFNISYGDADDICFPKVAEAYDATPTQAAHVLRHFAATGIVDWTQMEEVEA